MEITREEITENTRQTMDEEEIHTVEIDGPYIGSDSGRFAVRIPIDSTFRSTGGRRRYWKISIRSPLPGYV